MTRLWNLLNQPLPTTIAGAVLVALLPVAGISVAQSFSPSSGRISGPVVVAASVATVVVFLIAVTVWRLRTISGMRSSAFVGWIGGSLYGAFVYEMAFEGVPWRFQVPRSAPWNDFDPAAVAVQNISVDVPPRCPRCRTELEQHPRFRGGYLWKCVACGLSMTRKVDFWVESQRALKVARRNWERTYHDPQSRQSAS